MIKSCVVKIENNGMFLQSGVLCLPSEESEVAYVFTVRHGIQGYTPSNVCFWRGAVEFNLPVNEILFHPDDAIDAAILIIPNKGLLISPYSLLALDDLEALVKHGCLTTRLKTLGYPALRCSSSYPGPNQQHHFSCRVENFYENVSSRTFMAFYDRDSRISESDPDAELQGFSGGGVFAFVQNTVFLCGIYPGVPNDAVHYRDFNVLSLQVFKEICALNNLLIPDYQPLIPRSLRKHLYICQDEMDVDHILKDHLQDISRCNFSELVRTSCGHCDPCEYGEYFYICDRFQQQLLKSSALLSHHNEGFDEHEALKVKKGEDYHEVRIICSDVRPTNVSGLIRALKQDYLGRNMLSEESLILWASKERCRQSHSNCTRAEYQNIVSDIARAYPSSLDYSDVNEAPEQLAIMNVPYILDEMEMNVYAFSDFINRM